MKITVKKSALNISGRIVSSCAVKFPTFTLSYDSDWEGFEISVQFRHGSDITPYYVCGVESGDSYYIPGEVLKKGEVLVSVFGTKGTDRIATAQAGRFYVDSSGMESGLPCVSQNAYVQYLRQVKAARDEIAKAKVALRENTAAARLAADEARDLSEQLSAALGRLEEVREEVEAYCAEAHSYALTTRRTYEKALAARGESPSAQYK